MSCNIRFSTFDKLGIYEDGSNYYRVLTKINVLQLLSYLYKGKIKGVYFPRQSIYYTYGIKYLSQNVVGEKKTVFYEKYILPLKLKMYYYLRKK